MKVYVGKWLSNLLGGGRIHRPWRRRGFVPSFLSDPNPMDVILFSNELFSGDHQLVQVVDDATGRTDPDA